jgi:hypothetical protein
MSPAGERNVDGGAGRVDRMADVDPPDGVSPFINSVPFSGAVCSPMESALTCTFSGPKHARKSTAPKIAPPCDGLVPISSAEWTIVIRPDSVHLIFSCHWHAGLRISSYVSSVNARRGRRAVEKTPW